jgi:hypothetical protein
MESLYLRTQIVRLERRSQGAARASEQVLSTH